MSMRLAMAAAGVIAAAGAAVAQPGYGGVPGYGYGYGPGVVPPQAINPANVMPNIYNPRTQPLSPYLNLFNGVNNPATNYYFGVRPGTVGRAGSMGGAPGIAVGGNRGAFFPQLAAGPLPDPTDPLAEPTVRNPLPPAGHPVVFNNTLGYFPGSVGGLRPGLTGVGASRPATSPARR